MSSDLIRALAIGVMYKEAWNTLYNCFGEQERTEDMELMDSVLESMKLDREEKQDALQDKTAS